MGVRPIIGCEVYVAPRTRYDRERVQDKAYNHLILLCENEEGYKNLIAMVSKGYTEGFYFKPRIDRGSAAKDHQGDFACLPAWPGKFPRHCWNGIMTRRRRPPCGTAICLVRNITIWNCKITVFRNSDGKRQDCCA